MAILKIRDKAGNISTIPAIVGPPGKDGKTAYEYAKDGGFTGTEEEFAEMLSLGSGLPTISSEDDGKVLTVSEGKWQATNLPKYEGEFEVIPNVDNDLLLNTSQTYMTSDIRVRKIPYNEVTNQADGTTVTIG